MSTRYGLRILRRVAAISLFLLAFSPNYSHAQSSHSIAEMFRRAQSLERYGNHDQAVQVYREIWQRDFNRYDAVVRGTDILEQNGRSEEALAWIRDAVSVNNQSNSQLWIAYGDLYDKTGNETAADSVWKLGLLSVEEPAAVALGVVDRLLLRNSTGRAMDWAQRGLIVTNDKAPFYRRMFDGELNRAHFADAATHAARYIQNDPVRAEELRVTLRHTELSYSAKVTFADTLIEHASREPSDAGVTLLAAELALETGRLAEAERLFLHAAKIDERGMPVALGNAQRIALSGHPHIAAQLYRSIVQTYPDAPSTPRAASLAATLFQQQNDDDAAEELFRWLTNHGQSMYLDEAHLALGGIALRKHRPHEARQHYSLVVSNGQSATTRKYAELGLAEVEAFEGRFDRAETIWHRVTATGLTRAEATRAQLRLAESALYQGDAEALRSRCDELLQQNPGADEANDCLALTATLSEARNDTADWQHYGRLRYLFDTGRDDLFRTEISYTPTSVLSGRIALLQSRALIRDRRFEEATDSLHAITSRFVGTPTGEEALWILGETLREHNLDPAQASAAYEKLLHEYPDTVYLGPARRAIRELRDRMNPA